MSSIQVIFFPDSLHEASTPVKAELSLKYCCYASTNVDEFVQTYTQGGKFVLLFSDAQTAVKFFKDNQSAMGGLGYKTFLYLNRIGKFSPDSLKILNQYKLNIYQKNESAKLLADINNYFSSSDPVESVDDIEFFMPGDNDGTSSED